MGGVVCGEVVCGEVVCGKYSTVLYCTARYFNAGQAGTQAGKKYPRCVHAYVMLFFVVFVGFCRFGSQMPVCVCAWILGLRGETG